MNQRRIIFYWLPVFVWMAMICVASSIPSDDLPPMPTEDWLFWAHRLAHLVEYSTLGILWLRAYSYGKPQTQVSVKTVLLLTLGIALFALFDEWRQSFTPGRTPQLLDSVFDTICGSLGMLIYRLITRRS